MHRFLREHLASYRELLDLISILGIEELSAEDRLVVKRARRLERFLTQPFFLTDEFTGRPVRHVPLASTIAGCPRRPSSWSGSSSGSREYRLSAPNQLIRAVFAAAITSESAIGIGPSGCFSSP